MKLNLKFKLYVHVFIMSASYMYDKFHNFLKLLNRFFFYNSTGGETSLQLEKRTFPEHTLVSITR
jgi:hypothetical protein